MALKFEDSLDVKPAAQRKPPVIVEDSIVLEPKSSATAGSVSSPPKANTKDQLANVESIVLGSPSPSKPQQQQQTAQATGSRIPARPLDAVQARTSAHGNTTASTSDSISISLESPSMGNGQASAESIVLEPLSSTKASANRKRNVAKVRVASQFASEEAALFSRINAALSEQVAVITSLQQIMRRAVAAAEESGDVIGTQLREAEAAADAAIAERDQLRVFWRRDESEWQPKDSAVACNVCNKQFSMTLWRYNCTVCGLVTCSNCSPEDYVDEEMSATHKRNIVVRACIPCRKHIAAHECAVKKAERAVEDLAEFKRERPLESATARLAEKKMLLQSLPLHKEQIEKCQADVKALERGDFNNNAATSSKPAATASSTTTTSAFTIPDDSDLNLLAEVASVGSFPSTASSSSAAAVGGTADSFFDDPHRQRVNRLRRLAETQECSERAMRLILQTEETTLREYEKRHAQHQKRRARGNHDDDADSNNDDETQEEFGGPLNEYSPEEKQRVRTRLERFFQNFSPESIPQAARMIEIHVSETELFKGLYEKFGVDSILDRADARYEGLLNENDIDSIEEMPTARLTDDERQRVYNRILRFYQQHSPENVGRAEKLLYRDNLSEAGIMQGLCEKYKVDRHVEHSDALSHKLLPSAIKHARDAAHVANDEHNQQQQQQTLTTSASTIQSLQRKKSQSNTHLHHRHQQRYGSSTFLYSVDQTYTFKDLEFGHIATLARLPPICIMDDLNETCTIVRDGDLGMKEFTGVTPLHVAALCGHVELITAAARSSPHVLERKAGEGRSVAEFAARSGCVEVLHFLHKHGVDLIYSRNTHGDTLLHCGARHLEVVKFLISIGADKDETLLSDNEMTPFIYATAAGAVDVAAYLQSIGANCGRHNKDHHPIIVAAMAPGTKGIAMMKYLLSPAGGGFDREKPLFDDDTYTPLLRAAAEGNVQLAELLCICDADIEAWTPDQMTPLALAVMANDRDMVKMLLGHGANKYVAVGSEPLVQIAIERKLDKVRDLLEDVSPPTPAAQKKSSSLASAAATATASGKEPSQTPSENATTAAQTTKAPFSVEDLL